METDPLSWSMSYDFPEGIGPKKCFLMYHEELESLVQNIQGLKRTRFWMTFSENYLTHLRVLENVGMTRIDPVKYKGTEIVPLKFLKAVLPEPASLGPLTQGPHLHRLRDEGRQGRQGKTALHLQHLQPRGGLPRGRLPGHLLHHRRTGDDRRHDDAQGLWKRPGVWNMEEFDPDPFMEALNQYGLPWQVVEL